MGPVGSNGPWTGIGAPTVEATLSELSEQAARAVVERVPSTSLVTLAVIGGYGRGEGGVERVGDELRPHNNVDLLLITRGLGARARQRLTQELNRGLAQVAAHFSVPIDLGVIDARVLRHARRHVLWYDLREGHRTIAGDPDFLRANVRFSATDIDPRDVRDLVVNRGTLLLINLLALARFSPRSAAGKEPAGQADIPADIPADWRKRIVRHAMKAVVGYGDALLYADGAYHYSYREKARRVRRSSLIGADLQAAYAEAIAFRFEPDYERHGGRDLFAWHADLLAVVKPAHQRFLQAIHGSPVAWSQYPSMCLSHSLARSARSPRDWVRCARSALAVRAQAPVSDMRLCAQYVLASPKDRLAAVFPAACYGVGTDHPLIRALVPVAPEPGADDSRSAQDARRRRFLSLWAVHGDVNMPADVRTLASSDPESGHRRTRAARAEVR